MPERCSTSTSDGWARGPVACRWALVLAALGLLGPGAGALAAGPAQAPPPPEVATPAPTVLPPPPAVVPGQGIYYPDWQELGPNERFATPEPDPGGLPRHVGLGRAEREVLARLEGLVARTTACLEAGKLASARVALAEAEALVADAEERYVVLKLQAAWSGPRFGLLDLRARLTAARQGPVDAESLAVARVALRELEARTAPLWKDLERLAPAQAEQRLAQLRRLVQEAGSAPMLVENPGWLAVRAPLVARLERAEAGLAIRVGQVRLLDATVRIDRLRSLADGRLAAGELEAAVGDLQALEEACAGFEHEYGELVARGYDPAGLAWIGPEGAWRGKAVLARVQRWRQEARRRLGVLGHAPASEAQPAPDPAPVAAPAPAVLPPALPGVVPAAP
ncbi:MAG: hypothetical protein VKS61_08745 [Candidatus Sericytochromatia bacterium]|nr:hypothetical protein [Candidatus Sericytochromatia bacterium]